MSAAKTTDSSFWISSRIRRHLEGCLTEEEVLYFCGDDGKVDVEAFIHVVTPRNRTMIAGVSYILLSLLALVVVWLFIDSKQTLQVFEGLVALVTVLSAIAIRKEHSDNVRRVRALGRLYGLSSFKHHRPRLALLHEKYHGYFEFRNTTP